MEDDESAFEFKCNHPLPSSTLLRLLLSTTSLEAEGNYCARFVTLWRCLVLRFLLPYSLD